MKLLQPVTGCEDEGGGLHDDDQVSFRGDSHLRRPPMKTTEGQPRLPGASVCLSF